MRGWYALGAALGVNYVCHRRGLPTICADTRRIPRAAFIVGWAGLTAYLDWHLYPPR